MSSAFKMDTDPLLKLLLLNLLIYFSAVDGVYLFTSGIPDQLPEVICSFMEEATVGQSTRLHSILFNVDDYDSNGAIPGRYANITQMAECLRTLAHVTSGRFHWFRETGIIESDDIKAILSEMDKAVNYSQKVSSNLFGFLENLRSILQKVSNLLVR